jgi:hypothetical protein
MYTEFDLPSWDDCEAICDECNPTALQKFIYDCEPSGYEVEREFRDGLLRVVKEAYKQGWDAALATREEKVEPDTDRLTKLEEDHSNLCRFVTGFDSMTGYYNG